MLIGLLIAEQKVDNIIAPKIAWAVRSTNASFGRDAASVTASSECREHFGITAFFENVSERNNTLHELNTNDETRENIPEEVSELSVTRTHFDRQSHLHHTIFLKKNAKFILWIRVTENIFGSIIWNFSGTSISKWKTNIVVCRFSL